MRARIAIVTLLATRLVYADEPPDSPSAIETPPAEVVPAELSLAGALTRTAEAMARRGRCEALDAISQRVRQLDAEYYAALFVTNFVIARCGQYAARTALLESGVGPHAMPVGAVRIGDFERTAGAPAPSGFAELTPRTQLEAQLGIGNGLLVTMQAHLAVGGRYRISKALEWFGSLPARVVGVAIFDRAGGAQLGNLRTGARAMTTRGGHAFGASITAWIPTLSSSEVAQQLENDGLFDVGGDEGKPLFGRFDGLLDARAFLDEPASALTVDYAHRGGRGYVQLQGGVAMVADRGPQVANAMLGGTEKERFEAAVDGAIAAAETTIADLEAEIARLEAGHAAKQAEANALVAQIAAREQELKDRADRNLILCAFFPNPLICVAAVLIANDSTLKQYHQQLDAARAEQARIAVEIERYRVKRDALRARIEPVRAGKQPLLAMLQASGTGTVPPLLADARQPARRSVAPR